MSMEARVTEKPGGAQGGFFCSVAHPTNGDVWCRRDKRHDGPHRAFVFSITDPEEWDDYE